MAKTKRYSLAYRLRGCDANGDKYRWHQFPQPYPISRCRAIWQNLLLAFAFHPRVEVRLKVYDPKNLFGSHENLQILAATGQEVHVQ